MLYNKSKIKIMNTRIKITLLIGGPALIFLLGINVYNQNKIPFSSIIPPATSSKEDRPETNKPAEKVAIVPVVQELHLLWGGDYRQNTVLMGDSHHVFIGKVVGQVGNKKRLSYPETQFEVEVISNIKGSLAGSVVVNQEGGYQDGVLYVVSGGDVVGPSRGAEDYLLQPGNTYLLATRYSSQENWYTLNSHPSASKLVSGNSSLTKTQLEEIAKSDSRAKELWIAYPNEILSEADIAHNNTRNSFQSL